MAEDELREAHRGNGKIWRQTYKYVDSSILYFMSSLGCYVHLFLRKALSEERIAMSSCDDNRVAEKG